jgi:modulator of FtsH protease
VLARRGAEIGTISTVRRTQQRQRLFCVSPRLFTSFSIHVKEKIMSTLNHQVSSTSSSTGENLIGEIAKHKVLKNTYMLLALTLLFTAFTAAMSVSFSLPRFGILLTLGGYFGLLFLTNRLKNSVWGLASVFALTGFMGLTLGPMLTHYLNMPNGSSIIMTAFGMTAFIFMGLSAYVLVTKKDFSFMGGMLFAGLVVVVIASIAAYFLQMPGLSLAISAAVVLLMSGLILYETSDILHGGETNYIMATVGLYITIFNLFTSLLHLLGIADND